MERYPQAYLEYLIHFHASRDYFECHEVMEEYWKTHPDDPRRSAWHGLIQVAVAMYHERRGNWRGAIKMLKRARACADEELLRSLGLNGRRYAVMLDDRLKALEAREHLAAAEPAFSDLNLPIEDPTLLHDCLEEAKARDLLWCALGPVTDIALIDRHRLRDRSDVIEARKQALRQRGNGLDNIVSFPLDQGKEGTR